MRKMLLVAGCLTVAAGLVVFPRSDQAEAHTGPGFRVECRHSHTLPDDPIVSPGVPGGAHLHEFWGNQTTDAFSSYESMRSGSTTCNDEADTSGYWVPAVYQNGVRATPRNMTLYYTPNGKDNTTIEPFPADLRVIAGNAKATEPPDPLTVWFTCGLTGSLGGPMPTCLDPDGAVGPQLATIVVHIKFQDCWDGVNLDSPDHKSHMAYALPLRESENRTCPESHPVPMEQINLSVGFAAPQQGSTIGGPGLTLASGPWHTAHADFWNTWDQPVLESHTKCRTNDATFGTSGLCTLTETTTPTTSTTTTTTTTAPTTTTTEKPHPGKGHGRG